MMNMLIAVYGTLRKGYGNHPLLQDSPLVGVYHTEIPLTLRASGFPVAIDDNEDTAGPVVVEVYRVTSQEVLDDLDALEGHPNWYCRREVPVTNGTETLTAWMYIMQDRDYSAWELVPSGDYADYRSRRHG